MDALSPVFYSSFVLGEVPSDKLRASDLPSGPDADRRAISSFAHTFDGYRHFGEGWATSMNEAAARWRADGTLPDNMDDLRACLFLEHRRERFVSHSSGLSEPDETGVQTFLFDATEGSRRQERYVCALTQRIRDILESGTRP